MVEEGGMAADEAVTEDEGRDKSANIYQRIHAVMVAVGGFIEKDASANMKKKDGGQGPKFDYITHDAVTAHIRKSCLRHGIIVVPNVVEHANNGNRVELKVDTDFINVDNPSERVSVRTLGYGADGTDKGPGKAMSYAVKYAYLKTFMLNSADDVGTDSVEHESDSARLALTDAQAKINTLDKTALNNLKAAIESSRSVEAIDEMMSDNAKVLKSAPDVTRKFFDELAVTAKRRLEEE